MIESSTPRFLSAGLAAAVAAALLGGCSGSQGLTPASAVGSTSAIHTAMLPDVKGRCPAHGGVRVSPCTVAFTVSNPGPTNVTVTLPKNKKGTLSEADNCGGASGIATVTQYSGDVYTVTAGAQTGSCTAQFNFTTKRGKVVGWADLNISNSI